MAPDLKSRLQLWRNSFRDVFSQQGRQFSETCLSVAVWAVWFLEQVTSWRRVQESRPPDTMRNWMNYWTVSGDIKSLEIPSIYPEGDFSCWNGWQSAPRSPFLSLCQGLIRLCAHGTSRLAPKYRYSSASYCWQSDQSVESIAKSIKRKFPLYLTLASYVMNDCMLLLLASLAVTQNNRVVFKHYVFALELVYESQLALDAI